MVRGSRAAALAAPLALTLPALAAAGEGVWTSQGPNADFVSALAVDTSQSGTVFAATYDSPDGHRLQGDLFQSADGGATWRHLVRPPEGTFVLALAVDPKTRLAYGLLNSGDLFQSADGGASWRLRHAFGVGPGDILVDPRDPETLYLFGSVCDFGPGGPEAGCKSPHVAAIWRQRPDQDWEQLSIGGAGFVTALAIDPAAPGRLYAGTEPGLWQTTDDARHWESLDRGQEGGCPSVSAVAVGDGGTVIVGYFRLYDGIIGCGGVYRSADAGATWLRVTVLPIDATSFAVDPMDAKNIWVAAGDVIFLNPAVYRSADGGENWLPVNEGLEAYGAQQLAIEAGGRRLHAATLAGVFDLEVLDPGLPILLPEGPRPTTRTLGPRPSSP